MRRAITALILILVLAACGPVEPEPGESPDAEPTPTVEPTETAEPTPAVETPEADDEAAAASEAAREALAERENVPVDEIEIVSSEPMEWTDSCLGLGGPAESCLQVITPGWLVLLQLPDSDTVVEARTDETGDVVRFQEATDPTTELPAAAVRAREALAAELGVDLEAVEVVRFTQEEWTDSCLGLGGPAEACLQVITPGWLVVLHVAGEEANYAARTDETGEVVRFDMPMQPDVPDEERPTSSAADRAREQLAAELGIGVDEVEVLSATEEQWRDSCLGMGGPAENCLQVITPGWRIVLEANGQTYEAHTDRTGNRVRIGGASQTGGSGRDEPGLAAIIFQRTGGITGEDVTYRIYSQGTMEILRGPAGPDQPVEMVPVDPVAVEELLAELEKSGFFELTLPATPEVPCCDFFVYYLTASYGLQSNSISYVESVDDAPDAAQRSVELVQAFVESAGAPTR
ncbi:MAG: hypothetical protein GX579_16145 [Chloroflexi bacterium]|mgnify:CR=1 FL=1|nr:hypothetical protein [Chloroflexota bacterium]